MTIRKATAFVLDHHRHNAPPRGGLFATGCADWSGVQGVAVVGRPVSRELDDGNTAEVTRVCTLPSAPKGSVSFLYAACWRAARTLGWCKLVTYTLQSESGASLRGAGWRPVATLRGRAMGSAWQGPDRAREHQDVFSEPKIRWEVEDEALAIGVLLS